MRLIGAVIETYKTLRNVYVPLEGLVTLFGANNAGKSNSLEAIQQITQNIRGQGGKRDFLHPVREDTGEGLESTFAFGGLIIELQSSHIEGHPDNALLRLILTGPAHTARFPRDPAHIISFEEFFSGLGHESERTSAERLINATIGEARDFWTEYWGKDSRTTTNHVSSFYREVASSTTFFVTPGDISIVVRREYLSSSSMTLAPHVAADPSRTGLGTCASWLLSDSTDDWRAMWPRTPPVSLMHTKLSDMLDAALPELVAVEPEKNNLEGTLNKVIAASAEIPIAPDEREDQIIFGSFRVPGVACFGVGSNRELELSIARPPDPWLQTDIRGAVRVSPRTRAVAGVIAEVANGLAPSFVRGEGEIGIHLLAPSLYSTFPDRLRVVFREARSHHEGAGTGANDPDALAAQSGGGGLGVRDWRTLGAGFQRWIAVCLLEACRRVSASPIPPDDEVEQAAVSNLEEFIHSLQKASAHAQRIYLVDEPETHLHPSAMHSVARWLVGITREGPSVLIATHSPIFLDTPTAAASMLLVSRHGNTSSVYSLDDDLRGLLEAHTHDLGITPGDLIQLSRGVLVVEGPQDERIVRHFFGSELAAARVVVLPLFGANEALALVEAEFLGSLGKPLILLLDNVRGEFLRATNKEPAHPVSLPSQEEMQVQKLLTLARRRPLHVLDYPLPDIICALPDDLLDKALRKRFRVEFPGWPLILTRYRGRTKKEGFKSFLMRDLGIRTNKSPTGIVRILADEVLSSAPANSSPAPALTRAIQEALAVIDKAHPPELSPTTL